MVRCSRKTSRIRSPAIGVRAWLLGRQLFWEGRVQHRDTATAGIYIHIPWCRSICTYCDFDRQAHAFELIPAYVEALVADIRRQPSVAVHSLFFGGGTPSLLTPDQIGTVLAAARSHFRLRAGAEI